MSLFCWSDSTATLAWIVSPPHMWGTFVANRVRHIQAMTQAESWHYVLSQKNAADIPSRGLLPTASVATSVFRCGPAWLAGQADQYPVEHPDPELSLVNAEARRKYAVAVYVVGISGQDPADLLEHDVRRHSRYGKARRVQAYIDRYSRLALDKVPGPGVDVTLEELAVADLNLFRQDQAVFLPELLQALQSGLPIPARYLSLSSFLDSSGIIHVGGRLGQSELLSYNKKHPVLLTKSWLAHLIILDCQQSDKVEHASFSTTQANALDIIWVVGARSFVRKVVHSCMKCRRLFAKPRPQLMADLRVDHLAMDSPAFSHTGLDFAGPFLVASGNARGCTFVKCQVLLLTCMSTRAMHLELVPNMSLPAFKGALIRFFSRRNVPYSIRRDNFQTFVASKKELTRLLGRPPFDELMAFAVAQGF